MPIDHYRDGLAAIALAKSFDRGRDREPATYAVVTDSDCLPSGTWGRVETTGLSTVIFHARTPGRRGARWVQAAESEVMLL